MREGADKDFVARKRLASVPISIFSLAELRRECQQKFSCSPNLGETIYFYF